MLIRIVRIRADAAIIKSVIELARRRRRNRRCRCKGDAGEERR